MAAALCTQAISPYPGPHLSCIIPGPVTLTRHLPGLPPVCARTSPVISKAHLSSPLPSSSKSFTKGISAPAVSNAVPTPPHLFCPYSMLWLGRCSHWHQPCIRMGSLLSSIFLKLTAPVRCCSRMDVRRNAMPCHGVVGMLRRGGMLWRGAAEAAWPVCCGAVVLQMTG